MCCSVDLAWSRQIFILISVCLHMFSAGVMLAFPAVLNPAIISPNSTDIRATSSEASWIASINGISGTFGFFVLSPIFQSFGRKAANIGMNVLMTVGWIVLSVADSITTLLLARAIQGFNVGGVFILAVSLSEYSSPSRRGYFMALNKVSIGLGSLACHSLALMFTWRQISAFCTIPITLATILTLFWPESPAFLAMKGRFNECEKSFLWLNGNSVKSRKELKQLIRAQTERMESKESKGESHIKRFLKQLKNKEMLKACLIVALVILCIDSCGRYFLMAYMPQILSEITGSEPIGMYCSVVADLLLISALMISCFVIRIFKRRTLLFGMGVATVALMFFITLMVVLRSKYMVLTEVTWLIPCLILLHSFVAYVGLIPVAFAISSEVFPLEYRGLCSCISGIAFTLFYAATLKFTPLMIESTGISGTYAIYASIVTVCLSVLFYILPETKNKTLQEIENEMKGKSRSNLDEDLLEENGE